jgi:hypothetical protein
MHANSPVSSSLLDDDLELTFTDVKVPIYIYI